MFWDIFYSILLFLAGIGTFLYGLWLFSSFIKKNQGHVKNIFTKVGENRFVNLGLGTATTVTIQSSTATTVVIVGLVNAGVMTLTQSTAAIIGANIGSALSNMLLSLSAFRIRYFFMSLIFVGMIFKMRKPDTRLCRIADILISLGLLFIGLRVMSSALSDNEHLINAFTSLFETVRFPLLLVLLGFLLTAIIQSSSASVGIYISMAGSGVFGLETVLYLVIGSGLGTTLTMLIASIPASRNAKRAALIHLFFNIIGTVLFLSIIWAAGGHILPTFSRIVPSLVWQISVFSAILNITTALLLIGFTPQITKLACLVIPDKETDDITSHTEIPPEQA